MDPVPTALREAEAASLGRRQRPVVQDYERSRMSENFIFGDFSAM
jgi:hypothetical protein